mmetsp:Transcript_5416/g.20335  ORF Transcript_5416/g.20335 Transcript_5416/m.20335 type:complete len:596 (+) Transcript_5416:2-1789(+)
MHTLCPLNVRTHASSLGVYCDGESVALRLTFGLVRVLHPSVLQQQFKHPHSLDGLNLEHVPHLRSLQHLPVRARAHQRLLDGQVVHRQQPVCHAELLLAFAQQLHAGEVREIQRQRRLLSRGTAQRSQRAAPAAARRDAGQLLELLGRGVSHGRLHEPVAAEVPVRPRPAPAGVLNCLDARNLGHAMTLLGVVDFPFAQCVDSVAPVLLQLRDSVPDAALRHETLEHDLVLVGVEKPGKHPHRAVDVPLLRRALSLQRLLSLDVQQAAVDDELLTPDPLLQPLVVDLEHANLELSVQLGVGVSELHLRQRELRLDVVLRVELVPLHVVSRQLRHVTPMPLVPGPRERRECVRPLGRIVVALAILRLHLLRLGLLVGLLLRVLGPQNLGHVGQRGSLRVDVAVEVVLVALELGLGAHMLRNLGPVAEAVNLDRLEQQDLFVGAPVHGEQREGEVVDDVVRVRRFVRVGLHPDGEALDAQRAVRAHRALDPNHRANVLAAVVAVEHGALGLGWVHLGDGVLRRHALALGLQVESSSAEALRPGARTAHLYRGRVSQMLSPEREGWRSPFFQTRRPRIQTRRTPAPRSPPRDARRAVA